LGGGGGGGGFCLTKVVSLEGARSQKTQSAVEWKRGRREKGNNEIPSAKRKTNEGRKAHKRASLTKGGKRKFVQKASTHRKQSKDRGKLDFC